MKTTLKLLAFLLTVCSSAGAQVAPAAMAGAAHIDYSFHYAQTAEFGGDLGTWQTISPSAFLDYANGKERLPLSVKYSGGYTWTLNGPGYSTGLFQRLALSQGFVWRKWNIKVNDDLSYRPQAPTTGFTGIPGIGETIGSPVPPPPSSESILTVRTHVVDNHVYSEFDDKIGHSTDLTAGGGFELRRYPDGNGLNENTEMVHAGLNERLNARNSLTTNYSFSHFGYPDYGLTFVANAVTVGFVRQWNPKLITHASVGPQWISSSFPSAVPSSTKVTVNADLHYKLRRVSTGLAYLRKADDGAGYLIGAEIDSISGNLSWRANRNLTIGAEGSYVRTSGLNSNGVTNSEYGGTQISRNQGRFLTFFASYTIITQSTTSVLPANVLGHPLQVIGFGMVYSPRATRITP